MTDIEPGICNIELTLPSFNTTSGAYSISCCTRSLGNRSRVEKEFIFLQNGGGIKQLYKYNRCQEISWNQI